MLRSLHPGVSCPCTRDTVPHVAGIDPANDTDSGSTADGTREVAGGDLSVAFTELILAQPGWQKNPGPLTTWYESWG